MSCIDVVVPCYRYGRFLYECVESVLNQVGPAVRILVIDDASPDNTAEVASDLAQRDRRVTFVRHQTNQGHIRTYNEGIEWASGDYFLLLSADDYLLPGALSRSAKILDANPSVGFTYGKAIELRDGEGFNRDSVTLGVERSACSRIMKGSEFMELVERNGSINIVYTPTAIVRTSVQKRVGGYRHELPHSGDMEMWLRLAAHPSVAFINASQAIYRRHDRNMSIAYSGKRMLHDLEQRKAAFDCFVDTCASVFPDAERRYHRFIAQLSVEAIGLAGSAFNDQEIDDSKQLANFAISVNPAIRTSLKWKTLTFKHRMGIKAWRFLEPGVGLLRVGTRIMKQLSK